MAEAYIIDAVRTPRGGGKPGKGALTHLHPQHLAATVLSSIRHRNDLNTADIEDVVWSTATQKGKQGYDLGRQAALLAGYDIAASGMTLDRFCGGGITSVALAAAQVKAGMGDLFIAGGTEMMSYVGAREYDEMSKGVDPIVFPGGNSELMNIQPQGHQGVCADAIAGMEGISRADLDTLALSSQTRAKVAIEEGRFERSIVPVRNQDGSVALASDEHPRPGTTAESLANLRPAFEALTDQSGPNGSFRDIIHMRYPGLEWEPVHHAGNSSGVVDGAAAVLVASEEYSNSHHLKPRARIVTAVNTGDCPTLMLNGPGPAIKKALVRAELSLEDIDLFEINEAFAVVVEKCVRDLGLDRQKVNVNGGAMALGHPIGATGSILIGTLLDELERRDLKRGLVTMCAAGGMAPAIIIERA